MQHFMKKLFFIAVLLLAVGSAFAQKVSFEADAPSVVATDEVFRIEFSLNAKPDNFSPPAITGFDVLAGPTTSQGQSISIVNGSMTQTINFSYTYVLQAHAPGNFTIPAASVVVDGKTYSTKELAIEVVGEASAGRPKAGKTQKSDQSKGSISSDDILVRVSVNRNNVYKGQPIKATFKLYTRVPMSGVESAKYPAFNGFWTQELSTDNNKWQRETLNSKVYDAMVIREYLLYPQQAGVLHIEQFDLTVIAQVVAQQRRQSLIDDFFGGAADVQEVRKRLSAAPIKINVKELPAGAPYSFNGAVGSFNMTSDMPASSISANSATTYSVKISGKGNLPLIQAPKLVLPSSFEQYNIKTTESLSNSGTGISGYRQFEYPFIARAEGEYGIDPIEFSYFDPELVKYVTLATPKIDLEVMPDSTGRGVSAGAGMVSGLTKEDIKILGQDIRFIKIGKSGLSSRTNLFMGSWLYFAIIVLILALFVVALVYLKKIIKERHNSVLVKGKRANKVALQRFKAASIYMKEDNLRQFYEEMLRALWGYVSDKLNIPVANLTKDNVREELLKRGVSYEQSQRFIEIVSECEYAQYSPASSGQMNEVYGAAVALISQYESIVK